MTALATFIWAAGGKAMVKKITDEVVIAVAEEVMAEAVSLAPVDTGTLANSYTVSPAHEGDNSGAVVVTPVHYAPYVEFGTYKMSARPHLGPALEHARRRYGGV